MRLHEMVKELHSMAADPDSKRIIAHAQYWADCETAFAILRAKHYRQDSIIDIASAVPEAS